LLRLEQENKQVQNSALQTYRTHYKATKF